MEQHFHFFAFVSCLIYTARNQEILNHQNSILNNQLLILQGLSVSTCTRECKLRRGCRSVYYNTSYKICKINDVGTETGLLQVFRKLYTRHVDSVWKEDLELLCYPACTIGERCNLQTGSCEIHECEPPPAVANADIYGNRRIVSSKIQYRCKTDTAKAYSSVCFNNGTWSTAHACPERIVYVGCYKDDYSRDLEHQMPKPSDGITPAKCIQYCKDHIQNFEYAGLQNGNQCFCDDTYGRYGKVDESKCTKLCTGDPSLLCGGAWANMIHRTY